MRTTSLKQVGVQHQKINCHKLDTVINLSGAKVFFATLEFLTFICTKFYCSSYSQLLLLLQDSHKPSKEKSFLQLINNRSLMPPSSSPYYTDLAMECEISY